MMSIIGRVLAGAVVAISAVTPALAADAGEPAAERFGWSGAYLGVIGGFTSGPTTLNEVTGGVVTRTATATASGGFGGVQAGYDWQFGNFVVGAVADLAFTGHGVDLTAAMGLAPGSTAVSRLNYLGTVRLRGGVGMDRVLLYAHGGFAFGSSTFTTTGPAGSITTGRTGWTVGAGAEFRITERISIGAEYGYVDLGRPVIASGGGVSLTEDIRFHSGKATVNFRF
jgi:outer membrane immunogenic protein